MDATCAITGGVVAAHTGVDAVPERWLRRREALHGGAGAGDGRRDTGAGAARARHRRRTLDLTLEPYGSDHWLRPGGTFVIRTLGRPGEPFRVDYGPGAITVQAAGLPASVGDAEGNGAGSCPGAITVHAGGLPASVGIPRATRPTAATDAPPRPGARSG
ncbi:hypothetical protein NFX46_06435 [Streptomyces phaeoluteigriseus]|uniref:Uncharacterized protein n=1 Tax=Streptomyces phaeoluteigriseus TaxID=114686 RepID=A0ABY4Z351_9ACTN|nr:hypothetical protein [Streptomyces phaeoluteigriseus]USQ83459.1 hypothetical protein NFX46_06435 [Streptomyces phaeoluteigriseus]